MKSFERDVELEKDGWRFFCHENVYHLDWENGVKLAKKLGYKHLDPVAHGVLPPIMWGKGRQISFYSNAIEILFEASFCTRQQPKEWTGEIQIKNPIAEWWEKRVGIVKMMPNLS